MELHARDGSASDEAHSLRKADGLVVIDDDTDRRRPIALALRHDGHRVFESRSADAVLASIEEGTLPSLVIARVELPGLDGLAFARAVRARGLSMPIILLSTREDRDVISTSTRSGVSAVFGDPFEIDDLRTAVGYFAPKNPHVPPPERRLRIAGR